MKSFEYVKQIATQEYKDKVVEVPTIEQIEDWKDLIEGLRVMLNCSYDFIKQCKDINSEHEYPNLKELNLAGTNIQFATAQILATYNAYYDLKYKIEKHNEQVEQEKAKA